MPEDMVSDEDAEKAAAALKALVDEENAHRQAGEGEVQGEGRPHAEFMRLKSAVCAGTPAQLAEMERDLFFACVCADGGGKAHSNSAALQDITRQFTLPFSHDVRTITCPVELHTCELDTAGKAAAEWNQQQLQVGTLLVSKEHGRNSLLRTVGGPEGVLQKVRGHVEVVIAMAKAAKAQEAPA
jgi:hypothetical protein